MVCCEEKPSLRLASCCKVEVIKGGGGFLLVRFFSTAETLKCPARTAAFAAMALGSSSRSNWSSFLPAKWVSRAGKGAPLGLTMPASIVQYSRGLKTSISASRSQISRSETDCTRPAERLPGNLRHKTGESVKPTK